MHSNTETAIARITGHSDSRPDVISAAGYDVLTFGAAEEARNAQRILREFGQDSTLTETGQALYVTHGEHLHTFEPGTLVHLPEDPEGRDYVVVSHGVTATTLRQELPTGYAIRSLSCWRRAVAVEVTR